MLGTVMLLLIAGGHGLEAIEDVNMVEVEQGPYVGDLGKTFLHAQSSGPTQL
jgi:hypothetical protein